MIATGARHLCAVGSQRGWATSARWGRSGGGFLENNKIPRQGLANILPASSSGIATAYCHKYFAKLISR